MSRTTKLLMAVASDNTRSGSDPGYPVGLFYIISYLRQQITSVPLEVE